MDTTTIMLQMLQGMDDQRRADQERFEKHQANSRNNAGSTRRSTLEEPKPGEYEPVGSDPEESEYDLEPEYDPEEYELAEHELKLLSTRVHINSLPTCVDGRYAASR